MKKKLMLLFLFLSSCASVPPFEENLCVNKCSQCPGVDCQGLCSELNIKHQNENCQDEAEALWQCAAIQGCGFASECEIQIDEFLRCH